MSYGWGRHPYIHGMRELDSYAKAVEKMGKRERKKVAHNTYIHRTGPDTIALRLHDTDVLTWHEDGTVELDSGTWKTSTTKDRINRFAPGGQYNYEGEGRWEGFRINVWTQVGTWYVSIHTESGLSRTVKFHDGMLINPDGRAIVLPGGWRRGDELDLVLLPDADPDADLREYRREKARERREYLREQRQRGDRYAQVHYGDTEGMSERAQIEAELEHRDQMWRQQRVREVTGDPNAEGKVYVPEFAKGKGKGKA